MRPPSLDFHPRAIAEARAARRWYAQRSAALAGQFLSEFDDAVNQIATTPAQWPAYLHGTRFYRLRHFPYLVVYRETAAGVQIVAVAHTRRRPGYWRRRTP
jgi:plasmid stabilization system protein ParE